MKNHLLTLIIVATCGLFTNLHPAAAQGTAFTYQGLLRDTNYDLASGSYDLTFTLYNTNINGTPLAGPLTNSATLVSNGVFCATIDFGATFDGTARWLEIGVQTNGGLAFATLAPRQPLTPSPYAIFAGTAGQVTGVVANASLVGAYSGAVTFNNAADQFSGVFFGDGTGLTNVSATTLGGLPSSSFWQTTGNSGTSPQSGNFLGTVDNQPLEFWVNDARAFRIEPASGGSGIASLARVKAQGVIAHGVASSATPNLIGGAPANAVASGHQGAVIGGGGSASSANDIGSDFGVIGGGSGNVIGTGPFNSVIGGGAGNTVQSGAEASLGGGNANTIISDGSDPNFIGASTIAGGNSNSVATDDAFIGGGVQNQIQNGATAATIAGGQFNAIYGTDPWAFIGGGCSNNIQYYAFESVIGGGAGNQIQAGSHGALIGGGDANTIGNRAVDSTIAGGQANQIQNDSLFAFIGGGTGNLIGTQATNSSVAGGFENVIAAGAVESFVGGGNANGIGANTLESVIGGGTQNTILSNVLYAAIGGGSLNSIQAWSGVSFIGSGYGNTVKTNSPYAFIGGGSENLIGNNTAACAIAGGSGNVVTDGTQNASIGGGQNNTATGFAATIPGGNGNVATNSAFAAGYKAQAVNEGSFVWADDSGGSFSSTANDQVSFRCAGGVIFTGGGGGDSPYNQNVSWTPGSGAWSFTSDRNAKEKFQPLDVQAVLQKVAQLPLTEWSYKGYGDRHVGPMAQDFHAAFPFNANDKMLNSADEAGVTLAAVQGLNQKLESEVKTKDAEITALQQRMTGLENLMKRFAATVNPPGHPN